LALLKQHAEEAGRIMGVRATRVHGLPDNRIDQVPLVEVARAIEDAVEESSPDRVLTHHPGDLNVDHSVVCRATLIATRPLPGSKVREVLSYEVASSTEWSFSTQHEPFRPNYFVDIGATLEAKVAAMSAYESEARAFPHPRAPEALAARAAYWGSVVGVKAAEPFQILRWLA
jgi:LmbE family N-acetylglucosaminyl deacetylase